uniref:Uncharacterized protein n=1 Tax=Glossina austeni TaxID=7395 RepID=A0A1A9V736_GLOAU
MTIVEPSEVVRYGTIILNAQKQYVAGTTLLYQGCLLPYAIQRIHIKLGISSHRGLVGFIIIIALVGSNLTCAYFPISTRNDDDDEDAFLQPSRGGSNCSSSGSGIGIGGSGEISHSIYSPIKVIAENKEKI